jgi:hypothetical protein
MSQLVNTSTEQDTSITVDNWCQISKDASLLGKYTGLLSLIVDITSSVSLRASIHSPVQFKPVYNPLSCGIMSSF